MKKYFQNYFEVTFWASGLLFLALFDPSTQGISLCFFKLIGLGTCPGCGLGHSISWLFHGNFQRSLDAHPLGFIALVILLARIGKLIRAIYYTYKPTL